MPDQKPIAGRVIDPKVKIIVVIVVVVVAKWSYSQTTF